MRPLILGTEQILERGGLGRLLGIVGEADGHQVAAREVVVEPLARRFLRQVQDVLVVGDDVEIVVGDATAFGQQHGLRVERLHRREHRIAATGHGFGRADVVLRVVVGDGDVVLLLEIGVGDVGLDLSLSPGAAHDRDREIVFGPSRENRPQLRQTDGDCSRARREEKVTTR